MPYCIYLRKSRADMEAEAHGEGETLARHEKTLLELADRQKLFIAIIYREIVSGETISARPVMQRLLSEVDQGLWSGVVVTEIERLARGDTIDQGIVAQAFKNSGTKIITPAKTYDPSNEFDEEYFEFGLFMSRREFKAINRRIQSGKLAASREGKYVPGTAPYGYERLKLPNQKGYTLQPHHEEADVVKFIFDLYTAHNATYSSICKKLTELNIKPREADYWKSITIRGILSNPVYIGKITWAQMKTVKVAGDGGNSKKRRVPSNNGIVVDGLHTPLISTEQWDAAQRIRNAKLTTHVTDKYVLQNPLSGILTCGVCGRIMVRTTQRFGYPNIIKCETPFCRNASHRLDYVENLVLHNIKEWLAAYTISYQNKKEVETKLSLEEKTIKKVKLELNTAQKQLDSVYTFLEQGIYTPEDFINRSNALKGKIEQLAATRDGLEIKIEERKRQNPRKLADKIERVIDLYDTLPNASAKNKLLKEVLNRVEYTKAKGSSRVNPEIGIKIHVKVL